MSSVLKKSKNQQNEYEKRQDRIEKYLSEYENYALQNARVTKQLKNWKEINSDGELVWKEKLRFSEGERENEFDNVYFKYPKPKVYKLTKDKLRTIENRLRNEKNYLNFLEQKIKKNKY